MSLLFFKKYFYKYTDKKKYFEIKEIKSHRYKKNKLTPEFENKLAEIRKNIRHKKELNFKHSGHIGDIMYALPVIHELSKTHTSNLYIHVGKPVDKNAYKHTAGNVFINERIFEKLLPLIKNIEYIKTAEKYKGQTIDIDLDLFREFPFDLNFITVRWFAHITGVFPDFSVPVLKVTPRPEFNDKVVIIRSFRVRNSFVNYSFLKNYENLLFLGLPDEFEDLQKQVPNLKFYDAKDFLELAEIIGSCKFYLGNQSFGFALAEMLKVPRLLEAYSDFPVVHPIGVKAYDFYFQQDFEILFQKLYYHTN